MQEVNSAEVVARELKRPLLELRQLALGLEAESRADAEIRSEMVNVAERAMRQVEDLTKVQRLMLGNEKYRMEPVAVRAVCDDVIKEIGELFGTKTCEMTVKYSNRSRLVMANPELLHRVVYNFLLDATHYASIDTKAELKVRETGKNVEVAVRDFGPALPTKVWKEIKSALVTKPSEIAMRPGSSALGLYAASKFSKYMNAEVGAVRHRDGTSFFVRLPVLEQQPVWGLNL